MFKSFISRRKKPESRIHTDLTPKARERIASITNFAETWHIEIALKELQDEMGVGEIKKFFVPYSDRSGLSPKNTHDKIICSSSKEIVFSYLEHLLRIVINVKKEQAFNQIQYYSSHFLKEVLKKIREVLMSEGILWELKIKKDELEDYYFEFHELASILQKESDEELQKVYLGTKWGECLKGYNEAYNTFLSGANSFVIPEKLYCSFEEVAKKISSEEDWKMGKKTKLSRILEKIKEENILGDKSIFLEINILLDLLIKHSSKLGGDRKRHINLDKYYCNLLLHQSSAWLTYIIKKYEDFKKR